MLGNMIGSGIFLLPASLAIYGTISLVGWFFSAIGAICLALVFSDLTRIYAQTIGGPYAYTRKGLGDFPAFLVAWGYWISIWSTNAAIAVALVGYLSVFFPMLSNNSLAAVMTGLSFIWLFSFFNTKSIKTVGAIQLITTILKILPIMAIALIGIFMIDTDYFLPINKSGTSHTSAITSTVTLSFFAFLGMESASITSRNTIHPEKNIPIATIAGTLIAALIYILSSTAIMGIVPPEQLANSNAPFADAASLFWGDAAKYIVAAGAVISTLGALNGWILIQGQIPLAAAKDKLFPAIFGRENKHGSPAVGIILSSILVSVLMMANYSKSLVAAFTYMMTLSTLSVISPYIFSTLSYTRFLLAKRNKGYRVKLLLALFSFFFCVWVIMGCGYDVIFLGLLLLLVGVPLYFWLKRSKTIDE